MGSMAQITKRSGRRPAIIKLFVVLNILMLDAAIPEAQGASCTADSDARPWTVVGDAATDADISGAACIERAMPASQRRETRAWFFSSTRPHRRPQNRRRRPAGLKPASGEREADAKAPR